MEDKVNTIKQFTPEMELLFIKRNALVCILMGLLFGGETIEKYLSSWYTSQMNWIELTSGIFIVTITVLAIVFVVRSLLVLPNWKYFFWNGNCDDEYLNHLNHRAYKYAANTMLSISALLFILSPEIISLSTHFVAGIILSFGFLAYGIPLLFWLREDNE
jgi:hypothetical protein